MGMFFCRHENKEQPSFLIVWFRKWKLPRGKADITVFLNEHGGNKIRKSGNFCVSLLRRDAQPTH